MAALGGPDEVEGSATSTLVGLGITWEKDEVIRGCVLKNHSLLQWPKPSMVGVISFTTIALNARVLDCVLRNWCPKSSIGKTLNIDDVRAEDTVS